jgi:hypothetical protein
MYETQDLHTAIALRAYGFDLVQVKKDALNPRRATFVFHPQVETGDGVLSCEQALQEYWDYGLSCPARRFIEALMELKSRVYAAG